MLHGDYDVIDLDQQESILLIFHTVQDKIEIRRPRSLASLWQTYERRFVSSTYWVVLKLGLSRFIDLTRF